MFKQKIEKYAIKTVPMIESTVIKTNWRVIWSSSEVDKMITRTQYLERFLA